MLLGFIANPITVCSGRDGFMFLVVKEDEVKIE